MNSLCIWNELGSKQKQIHFAYEIDNSKGESVCLNSLLYFSLYLFINSVLPPSQIQAALSQYSIHFHCSDINSCYCFHFKGRIPFSALWVLSPSHFSEIYHLPSNPSFFLQLYLDIFLSCPLCWYNHQSTAFPSFSLITQQVKSSPTVEFLLSEKHIFTWIQQKIRPQQMFIQMKLLYLVIMLSKVVLDIALTNKNENNIS